MIDCDVGLIDGVETITQRVAWMMRKGYAYGKHFLPHDAAQTERGGSSFERELRSAGFANVVVLKRCIDIWTGINGLKGMFPSLVFHSERCAKGIEALEAYHTREVDIGRLINSEPVHDWSSHTADAARYMAEAIQQGHVKVGANMTRSMEDMDFGHGFAGRRSSLVQDTGGF